MKYYLAHHGKQGQHWGVRHGPPYPLDSNASKQAKRKSASKSSYDKLYGDKKGSTRHTGHTPGGLIYKNKKAKAAKMLDQELKNNRDFYKNTYKKDVQKETNALIKKTITPKILAATAAIPITISTGGSALPILLASYGGMALGSAGVGAIKAKRRGNDVRKAAVTNAAYALAPLPGGVLGYKAASNVRKKYIKKIADNI